MLGQKPTLAHFWLLLPTLAQFCPSLTTLAHFCPLSLGFAQFCPLLPTVAQFCPLSPTFAHFCPLSPTFTKLHNPTLLFKHPAYLSYNPNSDEDLILTVETASQVKIVATYVTCSEASKYLNISRKQLSQNFNNFTKNLVPNTCLQYHKLKQGTVKSFNFQTGVNGNRQHLNNHDYKVCVDTQIPASYIQVQ